MSKNTSDQFSLVLNGAGIKIEKNVDQETAAAIAAIVMGNFSGLSTKSINTAGANNSRKSLKEFMLETAPSTNVEKITAIGSYLQNHKSKEMFSKKEIEDGFRKARESIPSNFSRDFNRAIRKGYIDESEESGKYYVTVTGENLFDITQEGPVENRSSQFSKATRKPPSQKPLAAGRQSKEPKKKNAAGNLSAFLADLVETGYFDEPRKIGVVKDKYHKSGVIVKTTSLSGLLLRAVRDGSLSRNKLTDNGKTSWVYSRATQ